MSSERALFTISPELKFFLLEENISDATSRALSWVDSGLTVRNVRGRKMHGYQSLFDEFAAALQFPWYFGENVHAFDECLADLSWLSQCSGYVLLVVDPSEVLSDTDDNGLGWFVQALVRANSAWAAPVEAGEWWDRPAVPFHVVLQAPVGDTQRVSEQWRKAGAEVVAFSACTE